MAVSSWNDNGQKQFVQDPCKFIGLAMCEMTFPSIFASRSVGDIGWDFRSIDGKEMCWMLRLLMLLLLIFYHSVVDCVRGVAGIFHSLGMLR